MKHVIPMGLIALSIAACSDNERERDTDEVKGVGVSSDGVVLPPVVVDPSPPDSVVLHENRRFRNVQVSTIGEKQFRITGEAQVFEGTISWTMEDGHNVLKEGHENTTAGAPEWGQFDFTVKAEKERDNSTIHLILYETSAKDGSRQHELPLLLY